MGDPVRLPQSDGSQRSRSRGCLPQMTRPHQEAERPQSRLMVHPKLPQWRLPGGGVAVFDAAVWAEAYAHCRPALNVRTVRRSDECPCPLDSEIAEERRTYRGGLVPASMVVDQWRRWVNEIFLRWQSQVHCMACNEKSRQRARIRQQSQLRLPGEELRLAAAWVRTGRAESDLEQPLAVLAGMASVPEGDENVAVSSHPSSAKEDKNEEPACEAYWCRCPRGCYCAGDGDCCYCEGCYHEWTWCNCDCEGCRPHDLAGEAEVTADYAEGASTTSSGSRKWYVGLFGGRGIH